jgi:hypothetical protein
VAEVDATPIIFTLGLNEQQVKLISTLHDTGVTGMAFRKLIEAGVEESWLETKVATIASFYPKTKKTRSFSKKYIDSVKRIASNLEAYSIELKPYLRVMRLTDYHWPIPFEQVVTVLQEFANALELSTADAQGWQGPCAQEGIVFLIDGVRVATGGPHYEELATLLTAAYGATFNAEELRALSARRRKALASVTEPARKRNTSVTDI